jgi:hypothetical protein
MRFDVSFYETFLGYTYVRSNLENNNGGLGQTIGSFWPNKSGAAVAERVWKRNTVKPARALVFAALLGCDGCLPLDFEKTALNAGIISMWLRWAQLVSGSWTSDTMKNRRSHQHGYPGANRGQQYAFRGASGIDRITRSSRFCLQVLQQYGITNRDALVADVRLSHPLGKV